ncbi:ATP-binding protein [Paracraurococcus lichenis]|uniref:ATP-binding protein n=1 Tax=Paracraurococcus lichenis TaxID=3064888 RepID=A0ABT9E9Q9_9PROT|nr:ATP-binding protein [Paracraurococcus sp. LOR1-02]MDO9712891.1 ATP-binding protein [Paracraurococcus sp. LOR1-02]
MDAVRRPLAAELERLDALLHREILRLRAGYELSLDEFRGLYVSDEQVDALLRARNAGVREAPPPRVPPEPGSAWARLAEAFALSSAEREVLVLAVAPELDARYETLFAYLNNNVARRWPTVELALRLLDDATPDLRAALLPEGRLAALGLIEHLPATAERRPERLREFAAAPLVARVLLGLPLPIPPGARWLPPAPGIADTGPLRATRDGREAVLVLEGAAGSGRLAAARALAAPAGVVAVEACTLPAEGWPAFARAAALLARLQPALVFVDATGLEGRGPPDLPAALDRLQGGGPLPPCLATAPGSPLLQTLRELPLRRIAFPEPDAARRRTLWEAALAAGESRAEPQALDAVAERFRLNAGQIARAARDAALSTEAPGPLPAPALFHAAREQSGLALGQLASRVRSRAGWHDLVLPAPTLARLKEVAAAIAHRGLVQQGWGMGRLSAAPDGLAALFQGPPGTGKTMAASVVADGLGLDLYRVDLATVVSKYIGETERNLDRIFASARGSNAVLLFDEADALFGRRSEVKDAHDRYANLEVAYLLQRMEDHDGPVILATNLARNMDQAFARRLHFIVEFPRPDAAARERLWRAMLAPPLPCAADLDHAALARGFELTGGEIRKVALEAAFAAAASEARNVGMPLLLGVLGREMARQGRMVPSAMAARG